MLEEQFPSHLQPQNNIDIWSWQWGTRGDGGERMGLWGTTEGGETGKIWAESMVFLAGTIVTDFLRGNRIILTFLRCSLVVFLSHYATCFHNWKCLWRKRKRQLLKVSHFLHLRNLCFLRRELIWCFPVASFPPLDVGREGSMSVAPVQL